LSPRVKHGPRKCQDSSIMSPVWNLSKSPNRVHAESFPAAALRW
jgi:hypothetical protein